MTAPDWAGRADQAENAVVGRHLRRVWDIPGTALGRAGWPATRAERDGVPWHYWWQAHLLDAAVDAWRRSPTHARRRRILTIARSIRLRNLGRWTNDYHDDIAWLGLALNRSGGAAAPAAVRVISRRLCRAWTASGGQGIPWRVGDEFRNAPANGPAAILLSRTGFTRQAGEITDWVFARLLLPSGLIADGVRDSGRLEPTTYTYCQGVALGAALAVGGDRRRIHDLVAAVAENLAPHGVIRGNAGEDAGLFAGILARYLVEVAARMPGSARRDRDTRQLAADLVLRSARSAWRCAIPTRCGPLFGPDWSTPARLPSGPGDPGAERDLSVQLSGWLLMEAAAALPDSLTR